MQRPPFHLPLQIKPNVLDKQLVNFRDLGVIEYKTAWDYQEKLLAGNVRAKSFRAGQPNLNGAGNAMGGSAEVAVLSTEHYLLLCEHPPVYTLGKSGREENILISRQEMQRKGIEFYHTNRGGDITFHGPGQLVGYPVFDLERFYTDIGRYLRDLEQVIIFTLAEFGIAGMRSEGETGVWIEADKEGKERKICAMGVRCSRWITMHGFALNINTDLAYFDHIIPCGIRNKKVTSMALELGRAVDFREVKERICSNFEKVFNLRLK